MANPIHVNTMLEVILDTGMTVHVGTINDLRTMDLMGATVNKVSLIHITKQEMDVTDILEHNRIEQGATHLAPETLQ